MNIFVSPLLILVLGRFIFSIKKTINRENQYFKINISVLINHYKLITNAIIIFLGFNHHVYLHTLFNGPLIFFCNLSRSFLSFLGKLLVPVKNKHPLIELVVARLEL